MVELGEPPTAFAPLFRLERTRLLDVLESIGPSDWSRPTPCPGWSVLGLAAHLVGDDLSFLAWQRDDHRGTPAPEGLDEGQFIGWLDELQREWVHAARRLSPALVVELLGWLGEPVADTVASQDPTPVTARVSWASDRPVPVWLDQARELSERWIHRQQLLHALDLPEDLRADVAAPVLDGLRWAYPYRLARVPRPEGTGVAIEVTGPEVARRWILVTDGGVWRFRPAGDGPPVAELRMTTAQAWRLLTNNEHGDRDGAVLATGDVEIVETLLRTRAIIGHPQV